MTMKSMMNPGVAAFALMAALAAAPVWADQPMPGGTLHLVAPFGTALTSLDPHKTYESQDLVVEKAFHRSLYDWDSATNTPVLELAASVEVSPDGKTFTYKLLDNVFFHNGRKLVSDEVIWSLTRVALPETGSPGVTNIENAAQAENHSASRSHRFECEAYRLFPVSPSRRSAC